MNVVETGLPSAVLLEPEVFRDERGYLMETWSARRYAGLGLDVAFAQENVSFSRRGVLRGLHFQHPNAQGKLVQVLAGEVFDVAVDVRIGSPSFGKWAGVSLSGENQRQFYVPPGFAHGFLVTGESALVCYKCTALWEPEDEKCLLWSDPDLAIGWPAAAADLSAKDRAARRLRDFEAGELPVFRA
jgi:dTDP-4-dehydrorhamnose 3,5-epimerase